MSQIIDSFIYRGKKPLDSRDAFETIQEMREFPEHSINEGHISYCKETKKHYIWSSSNVDYTSTLYPTLPTQLLTGKWKEFSTSAPSFESIQDLVQAEITQNVYEGQLSYCVETSQYYIWNSDNQRINNSFFKDTEFFIYNGVSNILNTRQIPSKYMLYKWRPVNGFISNTITVEEALVLEKCSLLEDDVIFYIPETKSYWYWNINNRIQYVSKNEEIECDVNSILYNFAVFEEDNGYTNQISRIMRWIGWDDDISGIRDEVNEMSLNIDSKITNVTSDLTEYKDNTTRDLTRKINELQTLIENRINPDHDLDINTRPIDNKIYLTEDEYNYLLERGEVNDRIEYNIYEE